jgi:hypothetical protein
MRLISTTQAEFMFFALHGFKKARSDPDPDEPSAVLFSQQLLSIRDRHVALQQ